MPIVGRDIDEAARRILRGETAAFATETVYGLGARADDANAIQKMYALKRRPKNHPSIVHLHSFSEAEQWADIPRAARKLAAAFMPGALTLLLPARADIKYAAADGKTIALRVPSHPVARALLAKTGVGIAAPSANRFGNLSPTSAAHVCAEFADEKSLYVLDGGAAEIGLESAIVACLDGRVSVVRPGMLTAEQISAAAQTPLSPPPQIPAPGNLKTHYAPQKKLFVAPPEVLHSETFIKQFGTKAAALSRVCPARVDSVLWRAAAEDPREYARNLYALLRELDATAAECIVAETPPATSEWTAARDRLQKAAGAKDKKRTARRGRDL